MAIDNQLAQPAEENIPMQHRPLETRQPDSHQAMDPQAPHPETQARLRGGDRGGMCPGRFCFIIPCPLPCDFCFIPCPC